MVEIFMSYETRMRKLAENFQTFDPNKHKDEGDKKNSCIILKNKIQKKKYLDPF